MLSKELTPLIDYYLVAYDQPQHLIRGRSLRSLSAEEITATCELLLDTARHHGCPYWLLNGREHVRDQPQTLHDWMREKYLSRVRQELGQVPCIAFILPPAVWASLPARGYPEPHDWQAPAACLSWFTDEAPALA